MCFRTNSTGSAPSKHRINEHLGATLTGTLVVRGFVLVVVLVVVQVRIRVQVADRADIIFEVQVVLFAVLGEVLVHMSGEHKAPPIKASNVSI